MTVTYITADGSLATPDETRQLLDDYHDEISDRIDVELHGLTGAAAGIRRLVVASELADEDIAELEDYLGVELVRDDQR